MKKRIEDYYDELGFIVHHDSNPGWGAGDSSQRMGLCYLFKSRTEEEVYFAVNTLRYVWEKLNQLSQPVRHWDQRFWPGQIGIMSRDNLITLFLCFAVFGMHKEMWGLLGRVLLRGGFLWNTKEIGGTKKKIPIPDWCGPHMILVALRTIPYFGWLTTPLSDLYLDISISVRCSRAAKDPDDVGDDLNLIALCDAYLRIKPTKKLRQVVRSYYYGRPKAGLVPYEDANNVHRALMWYFRHDEAPPLDDIVIDSIKEAWPQMLG